MFLDSLQVSFQLSNQSQQALANFGHSCFSKLSKNARYLKKIICSDKCNFPLPGDFKSRTVKSGKTKRPLEVYDVSQGSHLITVWCAIISWIIVGPCFFENVDVTKEITKTSCAIFFSSFGLVPERDYLTGRRSPSSRNFCASVFTRKAWKSLNGHRWSGWMATTFVKSYLLRLFSPEVYQGPYIEQPSSLISELVAGNRAAIFSVIGETLQKVVENTDFCMRLPLREKWAYVASLLN